MQYIDDLILDFVTNGVNKGHKKTEKREAQAKKNAALFFSHLPVLQSHGVAKTLSEAGNELGITREGVRQTILRLCDKISSEKDIMVLLEKMFNELNELCPTSVVYANTYFVERGYIRNPCVLSLLKIYQKTTVGSTLKYLPAISVIENRETEEMAQCIHSYVIKKVVHNGAVGIHELMDRFGDIVKDKESMRGLVMNMPSAIELTDDHYYFGTQGRNRLVHRLVSIFNVFDVVSLNDLPDAITRCWKADINKEMTNAKNHPRGISGFKLFTKVMPLSVIVKIIRDLDIATIEDDKGLSKIKGQSEVKWIEREILSYLSKNGGESRERPIENHILSLSKKKRFSCMQFLSHSPFLVSPERGHYRLIGKV